MRRSRMMHPFFFEACLRLRKRSGLRVRPLLFEQTASIAIPALTWLRG